MQNDRTRYLIMAIVALVLAIVLLRYAHSQTETASAQSVLDIVPGISECEQTRVNNYELKREIIRLNYELFIVKTKELQAENAEYIRELFNRYQIDPNKFELQNGKFQPVQEKTK